MLINLKWEGVSNLGIANQLDWCKEVFKFLAAMDNDNFKHLRPEVNKPSRMLSESPDGKLRGIEPLRASCR